MASHGPLKKPTMASMPVLLFMVDHPELLFVTCSLMNGHGYHFAYQNGSRYHDARDYRQHLYKDDAKKPDWYYNDPAPEIPKSSPTHRWMQSDWMERISRGPSKVDDKDNPDNHWAWYDHPNALTDKGREVVEKNRAVYEEHVAAKLAEQKKIERYVVVRSGGGYRHNRKYGFLARVIRETKSRLYVEFVRSGEKKEDTRWTYFDTLHGSTNQYVDRADVTADGVTPGEYNIMRRVETGKHEWLAGLKAQEDAELDEIRERYNQRREQNEYAYEDELREALEQVKRNAKDTD